MSVIDLNNRVNASAEAKRLLDEPLLKQAFEQIKDGLNDKELSTKVTDIALLQDVVRCKQLLEGVERCLYRTIEDGKMAEKELELAKPKLKMFQR